MQHLELCISSLQTIRLKFIEVLNIHQYLKFLITFFLSWYQVMGKLLNRTKASCIIQFCFSKCAPKFERASKREFCHFVNEKCKKLQKTVSMSVKGWKGKRERMCSSEIEIEGEAVWPDVGAKNVPIVYKSCPKIFHISLM